MTYQETIRNYGCHLCGQIVQTSEIKELGIQDGFENVNVYKSHSLTGIENEYGICVTCKEILTQIIDERLSFNKKAMNE